MASGPRPKATHQRARDTRRRASAATVLVSDDEVRGPDLVGDYSPETRDWYETWRRAPQAQLFESTDWLRLRLLAPLVETAFSKPAAAALSEIRLTEALLGGLWADRVRAGIRITTTDAIAGAGAKVAVAARLTSERDRSPLAASGPFYPLRSAPRLAHSGRGVVRFLYARPLRGADNPSAPHTAHKGPDPETIRGGALSRLCGPLRAPKMKSRRI